MSSQQPIFNHAADATLARVQFTYLNRGLHYGDTLALPNLVTTFTEYVLGLSRERDYRAWLRLLQLAAFIDIKDSRVGGGGDVDDHLVDGVAYRSAFTELLREFQASPPPAAAGIEPLPDLSTLTA